MAADCDAGGRIEVLWSAMAADAAGAELPTLDAALRRDVADIIADAAGWFVHAVPGARPDVSFACMGRERADGWTVRVRLAAPDPPHEGAGLQPVRLPRGIKSPDNEVFTTVG